MQSLRKLSATSGVDRRTIADLEAERREARPETIEKLAAALGVRPKDLTGRPGMPPEQHEAYLDSLATEQKTYGPGDALYDADPVVGKSSTELAEFILENPKLRRHIEVAIEHQKKMQAAIEAAEEELRRLEAEGREDAG